MQCQLLHISPTNISVFMGKLMKFTLKDTFNFQLIGTFYMIRSSKKSIDRP